MTSLTFVTGNPNKLEDAALVLKDFHIHGVDFDVPEIQSMDPKEIIKAKLAYAYPKLEEPCFVMDASLTMECLGGFPGPFIKFWYEQSVGAEKTCEIANHFDQHDCRFVNTLGYFDGKELHYFVEELPGSIPTEPRGENGYHWDVIFIPEGETRTFAQMQPEEKMQYAPQKQLLTRLRTFLLSQS